jgi:hypothetical protein
LLDLAKGDGIEYILAFNDHPDNFVGAKYFFEGIILSGFGQVFYLEVIDGSFKGEIRQLPGEKNSHRRYHQNNDQRPAENPRKHTPEQMPHGRLAF